MNNLIYELQTAVKTYPGLKILDQDKQPYLEGNVELIVPETGAAYDIFNLSISFPNDYPRCFPKVTEITGIKIPKSEHRHVNPDGTLCLAVEIEEKLLCKHGITLEWFIERILLPRLAEENGINNRRGKYQREYDHGAKGMWQFYYKHFSTDSKNTIIEILKCIVNCNLPKGYESCICGSKIKFKKCHRPAIIEIQTVGKIFIEKQLEILLTHQ
jgi:ubiquitin-protein ligase